jgi:hypothetical protein
MTKKFLVLRDPHLPLAGALLTDALRARAQLDTRSLFDPVPDLADFDLCVFWLLDPCDNRPSVYFRALAYADRCVKAGVPVFCHPASLQAARKTTFASALAGMADLRVPRMQRFNTVDVAADPPFFVRENDYHGSTMFLVHSPVERDAVAAQAATLTTPILVEFIDTVRDGLYSKFRYVVAGTHGVPLHLQVARTWIVRGADRLYDPDSVAREAKYVEQASRCEALDTAAQVLGLDLCAFDYSFDQYDRIVVWEVNPMPVLHFISDRCTIDGKVVDQTHRNTATRRVLDAVVTACLERAR